MWIDKSTTKRAYFAVLCALCIAFAVASLVRSQKRPGAGHLRMTSGALCRMLSTLPVWRSSRDLTDAEWTQHITIARVVQQCEADVVEQALNQFIDECSDDKSDIDGEPDSRAFILLRVVFDCSRLMSISDAQRFKGWADDAMIVDGRYNASWPVTFNASGWPTLMARPQGSFGGSYAAAAEFRFFLSHFPYRTLPR